jgi:hypothetical protein
MVREPRPPASRERKIFLVWQRRHSHPRIFKVSEWQEMASIKPRPPATAKNTLANPSLDASLASQLSNKMSKDTGNVINGVRLNGTKRKHEYLRGSVWAQP